MSYNEYQDMFQKAQEKGLYHMFIFDIVNSRSYGKDLDYIEKTSSKLILNVYNILQELEKKYNVKILHRINYNENSACIDKEPFQFGDLFGFTIIKNSVDTELIYKIFEREKTLLNIYWDFHTINGFYETDEYRLGKEKYYRGYCLQQLEELSKKTSCHTYTKNNQK